MSIEIDGVGKRFGDFVALDNVSLHIPTGQLTALLGPSGGGKSTLLRIIAGLEQADVGEVRIEGIEATHLPPQKRDVGFVFQHYAAFKHLSVYRNVAFGLEIRKRPKSEIRQRVQELLELVHLEHSSGRPICPGCFWWANASTSSRSRSARISLISPLAHGVKRRA